MSIVSVMLVVVCILTGIFAYVLCRKMKHISTEDRLGLAVVYVIFGTPLGFMFGLLVNNVQYTQFCEKYQIDVKHTDFYRNNAESPVLVHVATYGTFSGEREQTVIVPPGQVRYFGHGKVLWVDSE